MCMSYMRSWILSALHAEGKTKCANPGQQEPLSRLSLGGPRSNGLVEVDMTSRRTSNLDFNSQRVKGLGIRDLQGRVWGLPVKS